MEDDNAGGEGGNGIMIRAIGGGDDAVFCDFEKARSVEAREFLKKVFDQRQHPARQLETEWMKPNQF